METINNVTVTIQDVAERIVYLRDWLRNTFTPADLTDDDGNVGTDIRLRINTYWEFLHGSSDYDQNHKGFWGIGYLPLDSTVKDCREIAKSIIEDCAIHYYENIEE